MKNRVINPVTISIIAFIFCNINVFSQIKKSGNESSDDFYIITTTKTNLFSGRSSKKIEYYYKGKRYTLDYWANHFMSVVKDSPKAVEEVKKYRIKMVSSTVLGTTCFGFLIGTFVSSKGNELNLTTAGIALVTGISSMIIVKSRDKNIKKAAKYFKHSNEVSMLYQNFYNNFYLNSINNKSNHLLTFKFKFNF